MTAEVVLTKVALIHVIPSTLKYAITWRKMAEPHPMTDYVKNTETLLYGFLVHARNMVSTWRVSSERADVNFVYATRRRHGK